MLTIFVKVGPGGFLVSSPFINVYPRPRTNKVLSYLSPLALSARTAGSSSRHCATATNGTAGLGTLATSIVAAMTTSGIGYSNQHSQHDDGKSKHQTLPH
jgi:hypothetical protein